MHQINKSRNRINQLHQRIDKIKESWGDCGSEEINVKNQLKQKIKNLKFVKELKSPVGCSVFGDVAEKVLMIDFSYRLRHGDGIVNCLSHFLGIPRIHNDGAWVEFSRHSPSNSNHSKTARHQQIHSTPKPRGAPVGTRYIHTIPDSCHRAWTKQCKRRRCGRAPSTLQNSPTYS